MVYCSGLANRGELQRTVFNTKRDIVGSRRALEKCATRMSSVATKHATRPREEFYDLVGSCKTWATS